MKVSVAYNVEIEIEKAPHILVAGATGMGKSAWINALLCDLVTRYTYQQLRLVLIDPKRVELDRYEGLPHLMAHTAMEVVHAADVLAWACQQMTDRFVELRQAKLRTAEDTDWPRIVIVVDELALLLLDKRHGKTIEGYLVRIATLGRAAGIHLVLATQSPRADVLTGLIRANVPTRVAFGVVTRMESLIILDQPGAERLRKPGQMLARLPGSIDLVHATGTYLDDDVIKAIVNVASKKEPVS